MGIRSAQITQPKPNYHHLSIQRELVDVLLRLFKVITILRKLLAIRDFLFRLIRKKQNIYAWVVFYSVIFQVFNLKILADFLNYLQTKFVLPVMKTIVV